MDCCEPIEFVNKIISVFFDKIHFFITLITIANHSKIEIRKRIRSVLKFERKFIALSSLVILNGKFSYDG